MKNYLQKQAARIRAICIVFALLPFFSQRAAAWSEVLVKGALQGKGWSTIATLTKQDANGNSYSGTINASSWTSGAQLSFKLYDSKDDNTTYWWGNGGTADMTSSSTATLSNVTSGDNMTLKHSTSYSSYNINCTYSNDSWTIKITGVKSSTGGGSSSTTTCAPGLYIYGEKYGKTGDQYIYKLQRSSDKQYYISLNAINGAEWSNVESYQTGQGIDNYKISTIGQTFHLVYVDANGKETAYYPSTNGYGLSGTDSNVGSSKTKSFSTTASSDWKIGTLKNSSEPNGGIYNFYVNTDVNGVPQKWYYEPDETRIVAYEVNSSTNTTDAYLYGRRANTTAAYFKNFFGMVSFVKDGYLTYLFGGRTYGRRKNSTSTYDQDVAADSPNAMQFSKDHLDTGIYTTEFNPTRDYIISGGMKPTRIFIIGSAINPELGDTYTTWDPSNAVEMTYDSEEGCYKTTITLNKDKQFRFLLDHNQSGAATSLSDNFGEDANKPGYGGDTDYNNKVQVESSSESGNNIVFNPDTKTYVVRFYVERQADKQGFQWSNDYGIYRYTIEEPAHMSTTITPPTATVAYGASLTPKVEVNDPDNGTKRTYAYTTDGSDPTIDHTNGEAKGTTKIVTYTPDAVIPTSDLGTFYMAPGNVLTFIDNEGNTSTLTGNKVTVKAQAVQTVTEGSKYRLDGNVATGNYTFKEAGVQPGSDYTISVTNNEKISVNKATATVSVTNSTTGKDDGVDVYYTTDGNNPLESTSARLVRDRKVTVYALPGEVGNAGTIKVAIPGTTASASCTYDITYSTSEGGYLNYQNNTGSEAKTLGGDGHVVVYVQPTSSNDSYTTTGRQAYVYAYEKLSNGSYASLTPAHRLLADADKTTVNGETWYALDLVPAKDYKEINVLMGYYDGTTYKTSDATVANACQDMFIKFDVATGQLTDVTRAYTGDHFYTTGTNGTKTEAANPVSGKPFFYAQVPLTWTSNGNSVKVLSGDTELSGATVDVQNSAETSDLSSVCKISVPTTLADKTELTLKPFKGSTASNVSFTITYQNGGYYFYESASHHSTTAPLVFSADASTDKDYRSYGRKDINHVTTGDKTFYLANSWTYTPELASGTSETTSITDNWNGAKSATVNVIPANTTISQTVTGLTEGTPYTVQMIVRGQKDAKGTLSLNDATKGTATDSKNFTGYDAAGTITTDGRVEALLSGTNNGWQKLEATANASAEGKLTISLAATGAEMELSDVTLLEKANIDGHVWTTVPTSNEKTDYDLSDRKTANAFSFFDRGDNKNAIVYANANTVLGMSENTYDVAVSNGDSYTMNTFALTDQAQDGTKNTDGSGSDSFWANAWKYNVTKSFTANNFAFDRHFTQNKRSTICVPVALSESEIKSLFGTDTKVYDLQSVDVSKYEINATEVTAMEANHPYIIFVPANYDMRSVSGSFTVSATGSTDPSKTLEGGYTFYSNYEQKTIYYGDKEKCYNFGSAEGGRFYRVKYAGVVSKPFRAYIKADDATTNSHAKMFTLRVIDDTTTGLEEVEKTSDKTDGPVYTITGIKIAEHLDSSLHPGIYIQNGRKVIVK